MPCSLLQGDAAVHLFIHGSYVMHSATAVSPAIGWLLCRCQALALCLSEGSPMICGAESMLLRSWLQKALSLPGKTRPVA